MGHKDYPVTISDYLVMAEAIGQMTRVIQFNFGHDTVRGPQLDAI